MPQQSDLLAVLVDADNVSPSRIGGVLAEIATYGTASVKRVYGDWTKSQLRGWKDAASEHVIQPMQQFDNTTGKNATDSALIIDAMDLLYTRRFQGFCIVSSDSDFTRLASRIREEGVTVYGFGERKTPEAFRNACDQFTYLEVLGVVDERDAARSTTSERWTAAALRADARLVALLRSAAETASADDGWSDLGTVGQLMRKQQPDFDPRNWGYAKLSDLVRAVGLFTIESKPGGMSLRPKSTSGSKASDDSADAPAKGRGDVEAGSAGGRSRRKPSSRAKSAVADAEAAASAVPEGGADSRDDSSRESAPAEGTSGSSARGGRPMIEQLTLGAALDAALDAVSSASRANATASAALSADADADADADANADAPERESRDEATGSVDAAPAEGETVAVSAGTKKTPARKTAAKTSARGSTAKTRTPRATTARTAASSAADGDGSSASATAAPAAVEPSADAASVSLPETGTAQPIETEAPARPKRAPRSRASAPKAPSDEAESEAPARPKRAPRSRKAPAAESPAESSVEPAAEPAAEAPADAASAPAAASAPVKRAPRRASRPGSSAS